MSIVFKETRVSESEREVTFRSSEGERSRETEKKSKEKELESHWRLQKPKLKSFFFNVFVIIASASTSYVAFHEWSCFVCFFSYK